MCVCPGEGGEGEVTEPGLTQFELDRKEKPRWKMGGVRRATQ